MEVFTDEFRARHGDKNPYSSVEESLDQLAKTRAKETDGYLLSPVSQLPSQLGEIMHCGVYRAVELGESAVREMNRRSVVSSCLLVRGVFETGCLLYEAMRRVEVATNADDLAAFTSLHTFLTRTLYGSKSKDLRLFDDIESVNVLTIIRQLSAKLEHGEMFIGFYERLSEYCHPNSHGMTLLYTEKRHAAVAHFTQCNEGREHAGMSLAVNALATGLDLVIEALRLWLETTDTLAGRVEKAIHLKGPWPADTPYPVTQELRDWLRAEAERMRKNL
jgi:hypothetical protein